MDNRPIGVFDSGVGGLTVVKELLQHGPNEQIIYFGDTARVPYGSKSKETVTKYSKQIIRFLLTKNVKGLIVACNTISSNSLEELQKDFDLPILGVVKPGALMAARTSQNQRIGIIGTEATVNSKTYKTLIQEQKPEAKIFGQACPLFVPLVEEGWLTDDVTYQVAKKYLQSLQQVDIDTLVLGCTHYPLLTPVIQEVMGDGVALINPALETVQQFLRLLDRKQSLRENNIPPKHEFYVSDNPKKFCEIGRRMLTDPMEWIHQVNIEAY